MLFSSHHWWWRLWDTSSQNIHIHDIGLVCRTQSRLSTVRVNSCRIWTPTQIYASIPSHVYFNSIIKLALCNGYHAMFIIHGDMEPIQIINIYHNSRPCNSKIVVMNAHIDFEIIDVHLKIIHLWATAWWHDYVFRIADTLGGETTSLLHYCPWRSCGLSLMGRSRRHGMLSIRILIPGFMLPWFLLPSLIFIATLIFITFSVTCRR